MAQKCDKISQVDGWELLDDILKKMPVETIQKENKNAKIK
jgi:hypothetical protein